MRNFTIVPASPDANAIEIAALSEAAILNVAQRLAGQDLAVFEGNAYQYSLRLTEAGGWLIFQRGEPSPVMRRASA